MTLEEVDQAIDALEKALATGTEQVRFADRTVTYRSVKQVRDALQYFKRKRNELTGNRKNNRFSVVRFNA
jgi:hypothetical protein